MTTGQLWSAFANSSNQDQAISHLSRFTTTRIKKEKGPYNETLLHWVASRGWTRACQVLVEEYGVDTECRDDRISLKERTRQKRWLKMAGICRPLI